MPERPYILHLDSQEHRERFLTALASWPGFVCFGNPTIDSGEKLNWMSALPSKTYKSSARDTRKTLSEIEATSLQLARNQRLAGVLGYEAGYGLEKALEPLDSSSAFPAIIAGVYDWYLTPARNHSPAFELHLAGACLDDLQNRLEKLVSDTRRCTPSPASLSLSDFSQDEPRKTFEDNVRHILDYILAGDCYQVNLSHRFQAAYEGDLWQAYGHLTKEIPTAHAGYLNLAGHTVLSISPESFLEIRQGKVVTKPIKGTRPRGKTEAEDSQLAEALASSEKDRAENIMIVDLLRNDLGRFCKPGSIQVDKLLALESYRNVHHLVSTVTGELEPSIHPITALSSAFPGGSITGAPKIRAMEIIRELEGSARGAYCGSLFSLDSAGDLYSNIAIRTLYTVGDTLYCHGGGGIVADSDPAAEFQETLDKVGSMMEMLQREFGQ